MADGYRVFASHLLFEQVLEDPLGHLYRAGEFGRGGVRRIVWLRIFDDPHVQSADLQAAFERARQIDEAVQSINIATGITCFEAEGVPALACDHVGSQPLGRVFERVQAEGFPVPVDNALLIVEKISLALSAGLSVEIEGGRIVHGFLHPGLIFVSYDGEGVVSGFGLGEELLALAGEPSASPHILSYLAPEVMLSKTPSRRGDVYSLGAILFELLTGSPLPAAPDDRKEAVTGAVMAYDDEPVPEDIRALLSRALAERPDARFSSASDFKKELDRLLYGGAYSPTTFNLALFMDRLFRAEMESEDDAIAAEREIDVTPYLVQAATPEPEALDIDEVGGQPRVRKPFLVAAGVAAAAGIAAVLWFSLGKGPSTPAVPPTPTAEEIALQRRAQEEKMRELAQSLVQEMMAEKEAEIRKELTDRQDKIEELQQRLVESEQRAKQGSLSTEEKQQRAEIQRQIAAEEQAQKEREDELEAERQRAQEEARRTAAVQQTATAVVLEEKAQSAVTPTTTPTTTPPPPTSTAVPTSVVEPTPTAVVIEINTFVPPSEVDSLPVAIKKQKVDWPTAALRSRRQGVIIMQATVNADGLVDEVTVLRADDEGFGIPEAAMAAATKYRFKPGMKNGVRIKTYATITEPYRFVFVR
jgi:TonB family protein